MNADLPRPIPCNCGAEPKVKITSHGRINILRLECECGKLGAAIFYTSQWLEDWARQAAIDGWNLRL